MKEQLWYCKTLLKNQPSFRYPPVLITIIAVLYIEQTQTVKFMSHNHSWFEFILQEESYITLQNSVCLILTQTLKSYVHINYKLERWSKRTYINTHNTLKHWLSILLYNNSKVKHSNELPNLLQERLEHSCSTCMATYQWTKSSIKFSMKYTGFPPYLEIYQSLYPIWIRYFNVTILVVFYYNKVCGNFCENFKDQKVEFFFSWYTAICIPLYLPEIKSCTFPGVLHILILRLKSSTRVAENMLLPKNK
jgi:hypothetical protein